MIGKWFKEADPSQLTWQTLIDCLSSSGLQLDEAVKAIQENVFGGIKINQLRFYCSHTLASILAHTGK